jgi:transposase
MARTRPWEVSEAFWQRAAPLIPARPAKQKAGRPAKSDRQMLGAILYVLRTGLQWNALPREIGASSTVYDRFRFWLAAGFFTRLWQAGLEAFDELEGLEWEWQSLDGGMTKAPFGGAATGANPTDRGKRGTKRSTRCEGHGLPLAVVGAGAGAGAGATTSSSRRRRCPGRVHRPLLVERASRPRPRPTWSRSSRPWWGPSIRRPSRAPNPTRRSAAAWRPGRSCASSKP